MRQTNYIKVKLKTIRKNIEGKDKNNSEKIQNVNRRNIVLTFNGNVENELEDQNLKIQNKNHGTRRIFFLNVQGISQAKFVEFENMIEEEIFIMVETQLTQDRIRYQADTEVINKMRLKNDRKGGGIMILWKKQDNFNIKEIKTKNVDLMMIEYEINSDRIYVVVVYMSTNDNLRNEEIEEISDKYEEKKLLIVGDFNGHIGYLGNQDLNLNGKRVIDILERNNLILINSDERCIGEFTWKQRNFKSVIDFVICNHQMNETILRMKIDEEKEMTDVSDHNLIEIVMKVRKQEKTFKKKGEKFSYYKINKEIGEKYIEEMKKDINTNKIQKMEELEHLIKVKADNILKVERFRAENCAKEKEPIWYNKDIEREMKKRREINRKRRNSKSQVEKDDLWVKYKEQKSKVQIMINKAITDHELKITEKIMSDPNRGKRIWKYIKMLKDQDEKHGTKEIKIYDELGRILDMVEVKESILKQWSEIYRNNDNKILEVWNDEQRILYEVKLNDTTMHAHYFTANMDNDGIYRAIRHDISFPREIREHMEYSVRVDKWIKPMEKVKIDGSEIIKQVKKMKSGKAPGPNGIKIDIYKMITTDKQILQNLTSCMNRTIMHNEIPQDWKRSNTILIPKCQKPTVTELRPIALTNNAYKIFMAIVKGRIEKHLKENDLIEELQSGSTIGKGTIDNIYILQYCINETFKRKDELFMISVDFSKAFDSIDRKIMIESLKNLKIDKNIINIIANVYLDDFTDIKINNNIIGEIGITSGIKQGCTGSALLFVIVTHLIIKEIKRTKKGIHIDGLYIPTIFYMDDGILLANNKEDIEYLLDIMSKTSQECGLKLNKKKCKAMVYNSKEEYDNIRGIETVCEITYLGIKITNQRKWDKIQIKNSIEKAEKLSNQVYQTIGKCCNRMLIGKTFWKGVAVPGFLYGQEVMNYDKKDIDKLQRIENGVYRNILGVPRYTAVEFLRGEIGATSMRWRIIKGKILYLQRKLKEENGHIIKTIVKRELESETKIGGEVKKEMQKLELEGELELIDKNEIIRAIRMKDSDEWRNGMQQKTTLKWYMERKLDINEEKWFKNGHKYSLMMKARSDTLKLRWRDWALEGDKICQVCDCEIETLEHFLLDCKPLQEVRNYNLELQLPREKNGREDKIAKLLLFKDDDENEREKLIDLIEKMYKKRKNILIDKSIIDP